jgi:undecaprenyl-diphosphatase
MLDALYSIDKAIFYFINNTIANPVLDAVMPALTDWNKSWIGLSIFGILWLILVMKGGKKGRIVGGALVILIIATDQLSSQVLKYIFERPRPCHVPLEGLRLLVDCGSGYSFPSSHAVNNSAFAFYMSYHYRRWTWAFTLYAVLICLSRVVVGVHYPSDVLGGAIIGMLIAIVLISIHSFLAKRFPSLAAGT